MQARKYEYRDVWMNGAIVPQEQANVPIFTQTAQRGANVYEGIRAYWNAEKQNLYIWKLDAHIKRLFQSMKIMRMTTPYTFDEYKQACIDWCRANAFREDVHFRLVVYLGDGGPNGVKMFKPGEIEFGAFITGGPRPHKEALENGKHFCVSSWRRISDDVMPPRVKAGANYQNSRLASIEARTNGYDDAIILGRDGTVAEATGSTIMIVRDGDLITSPVTGGILESITRKAVLKMFERSHNREPQERPVDRTEIYIADEVFCCGSAEEVTPIISVDRIEIGDGKPGPITRRLQGIYFEAARGMSPDYVPELTPVYA
ncbi:MAG: branched-chain-amino-acid transaminase [Alphaproteobacteria bacterium]|nr:branched-chain-amino-acid transaminase [Alphaproteobacteria bacterium]